MTEAAELIAESAATPKRERNAAFVKQFLTESLLADLRAAYQWHLQRHQEHRDALDQLSVIGSRLKNGDAALGETFDELGAELLIWMIQIRREQCRDGD